MEPCWAVPWPTWLPRKSSSGAFRDLSDDPAGLFHPGGIGVFIDDKTIKTIERQSKKAGYYDGRAMAFNFNLLRERSVVVRVVNNYLKGEKPAAFDLLYWNSDGTNLTGAMHGWYLRNMYLENRLIQPGASELAGVKLADLGKSKPRLLPFPQFRITSHEVENYLYRYTGILWPRNVCAVRFGSHCGCSNPLYRKVRLLDESGAAVHRMPG